MLSGTIFCIVGVTILLGASALSAIGSERAERKKNKLSLSRLVKGIKVKIRRWILHRKLAFEAKQWVLRDSKQISRPDGREVLKRISTVEKIAEKRTAPPVFV